MVAAWHFHRRVNRPGYPHRLFRAWTGHNDSRRRGPIWRRFEPRWCRSPRLAGGADTNAVRLGFDICDALVAEIVQAKRVLVPPIW